MYTMSLYLYCTSTPYTHSVIQFHDQSQEPADQSQEPAEQSQEPAEKSQQEPVAQPCLEEVPHAAPVGPLRLGAPLSRGVGGRKAQVESKQVSS